MFGGDGCGLMSSTIGAGIFIWVAEGGSNMSARLLGILFNSLSILFSLSICCIPCTFLAPFSVLVRSLVALTTMSTGVSAGCVMYLCLKNTVSDFLLLLVFLM